MNIIELEAQKACLVREILCMDDEKMINDMWLILNRCKPQANQQEKSQKREIGFLEGKAKVTFHDDWDMTPEELGIL